MPKLSVCIPTYDMGGAGAQFLEQVFQALKDQDFKDFEVVVSDQSQSEDVYALCHAAQGITVRHIWFRDGPKQASANTNNAMRHATGEIVKILFQDDLLNGKDALSQIVTGFDNKNVAWLLCGSGVSFDGKTIERPMVPKLHDTIEFGVNTVSSPSVLAMRRSQMLDFDEKLIWLMDVDIYKRLVLTHGAPTILDETLVINRLHKGQVSAGVSRKLQRSELRYIWAKFAKSASKASKWAFLKRYLKAMRPKRVKS